MDTNFQLSTKIVKFRIATFHLSLYEAERWLVWCLPGTSFNSFNREKSLYCLGPRWPTIVENTYYSFQIGEQLPPSYSPCPEIGGPFVRSRLKIEKKWLGQTCTPKGGEGRSASKASSRRARGETSAASEQQFANHVLHELKQTVYARKVQANRMTTAAALGNFFSKDKVCRYACDLWFDPFLTLSCFSKIFSEGVFRDVFQLSDFGVGKKKKRQQM